MQFVTRIDELYDIKISQKGAGSKLSTTVTQRFLNTVDRCGSLKAMQVKRNNEWKKWSFIDYHKDCKRFARGLLKLGLSAFDTINIIGFNSPEWCIAHIGAIISGCVPVGVYSTNNSEACHYIAEHSHAKVIVVENEIQLNKYLKFWSNEKDSLSSIVAIIMWEGRPPSNHTRVWAFDDFMEFGNDFSVEGLLQSRISSQLPGQCCSIIYTSGTTGNPKGVMISHDNIIWTVSTVIDNFNADERERIVSYLPLSHIAAQMIDVYGPVCVGLCVYFADKDALKGSLKDTLVEVKPTVFFGVPRVYEKIAESMLIIGRSRGKLLSMISAWGKRIGKKAMAAKINKLTYPWGFCLANLLVFKTVRMALGLDRCRAFFSGAAPLQPATLAYFESLFIPISELYGMSESSGPQTVNIDEDNKRKANSAGKALPGTEMVIMNADSAGIGEICYKGRNVFMGYLNDKDKSREVIDRDGFLHSGDLGYIDDEGFLYITGRIKEIIITAGGENIPPLLLENTIKEELLCVSNAVLIGDKRKFLSVLLTLKVGTHAISGEPTNSLFGDAKNIAQQIGSNACTVEEVLKCSRYISYINEGIVRVNRRAVSRAQEIKRWAILPREFSIDGGELTGTMKVKRGEVANKYSDIIKAFYKEDDLNYL